MDNEQMQIADAPTGRLHPLVYKAIIGFVIWLVLAIWGFAAGGYTGFTIVAITLILLVATALVTVLYRISRRNRDSGLDAPVAPKSIGAWLHGEMDIWQGRLEGTAAATQVILPIAAAAIAMTALVIVLHFDVT